jgi:hypothetical protein
MSASKGWKTKIVLEGAPVDEEMQGSPAVAAQTTFYTRSFPVVNPSTKEVTDDENDVTVKVDGVTQSPAAFTLTGALGRIVFGTAPGAGKVVTCSYTYKHTLAYGRSGEVTIDGGLEELHVLGQRTPKEILEGAVKISGSLERYFVSRDFIGKVIPDPDGNVGQTAFTVYLYPLAEESGKPKFTVGGVKFSPWTLSVPDPDSPITEKLGWIGTSITPGTV